jgi:hypothetical protein
LCLPFSASLFRLALMGISRGAVSTSKNPVPGGATVHFAE